MKKYLLNLAAFILVTICIVGFVSCGKNDDDTAKISGTWKSSIRTMELGSNGSYYSYIGSNRTGSGSQYRKGSYSYNASQNLLVIDVVAVSNHNGAYTDTYIVQSLTSSTLVLIDLDGNGAESYTRVK